MTHCRLRNHHAFRRRVFFHRSSGYLVGIRSCSVDKVSQARNDSGQSYNRLIVSWPTRTSCTAKVKQEGSFTIPARTLHDYVKLLPDADITIKLLAGAGKKRIRGIVPTAGNSADRVTWI